MRGVRKTVFSYFPTKESLLLDRFGFTMALLRAGLRKYLDGTRTPAQIHQAVTAGVRRAAHLIETGLSRRFPGS